MTKDVRINLRLTPDKRAAYHAAAKARGLKMTEWILNLADSALGLYPTVKVKLPDGLTTSAEVVAALKPARTVKTKVERPISEELPSGAFRKGNKTYTPNFRK